MNRKITSEVLAQGRLTDCKSNGRKQFSSSISRIFENSGQVYGTIAIIIYDFKQVLPIGGPFCLKYIIRIIPESLRLFKRPLEKAQRSYPSETKHFYGLRYQNLFKAAQGNDRRTLVVYLENSRKDSVIHQRFYGLLYPRINGAGTSTHPKGSSSRRAV